MFATSSKSPAMSRAAFAALREVRRAVRLPIVAIGGIDEPRAAAVIEAGADAAAMISTLSAAPDVAAAVRRIVSSLDSARPLDPLSR